ncbi:MAG: hypothetical protein AAB738_03280 [Patescibacteria group bacterium]
MAWTLQRFNNQTPLDIPLIQFNERMFSKNYHFSCLIIVYLAKIFFQSIAMN